VSVLIEPPPTSIYPLSLHDALPIFVIVALPVAAIDGPTGRVTDALVGGSFALLVAILTPQDARRRARQLAAASLSDLSQMLGTADRKSTRLNSSHVKISYAVFCLKK